MLNIEILIIFQRQLKVLYSDVFSDVKYSRDFSEPVCFYESRVFNDHNLGCASIL